MLVRSYCTELGIAYCETSLIGSYTAVVRHLNTLGAPLRAAVHDQPFMPPTRDATMTEPTADMPDLYPENAANERGA